MTSISRVILAAIVAYLSVAAVPAKDKDRNKGRYVSVETAVEADARSVVLPSGPSSTLLMSTCAGCASKPFPASARTTYYIGRTLVTLEALKAAVANNPNIILTVSYVEKT